MFWGIFSFGVNLTILWLITRKIPGTSTYIQVTHTYIHLLIKVIHTHRSYIHTDHTYSVPHGVGLHACRHKGHTYTGSYIHKDHTYTHRPYINTYIHTSYRPYIHDR